MKLSKGKPRVNESRCYEIVYLDNSLDLEMDIIDVIKKLQVFIEQSELDPFLRGKAFINYNRWGYDGGLELEACYHAFTESEDDWKARVKLEKKLLKEWEETKTKLEIEGLKKRLAELEDE